MKKGFFSRFYGLDSLSVFLLLLCSILNVIALSNPYSDLGIFGILGLIPLIICIIRTLSGNHVRRWQENATFLSFFEPLSLGMKERAEKKEQKKVFKFFNCPNCKLRIRVPKGKGRIEITCPKCQTRFIKKT